MSRNSLSRKTIEEIADLSRLAPPSEKFIQQLIEIIKTFEQLQSIDTEKIDLQKLNSIDIKKLRTDKAVRFHIRLKNFVPKIHKNFITF
ncbi:hypothetical protein BXT86_06325 [candidate division WOR-3 bacterium 4484_100]|uniref:Aspartyl/glutamyl-tRNA(Asn/Gln) amidotransferase subunit C n=1 Tax=candidate division WOR-3 bacterium 4484_100 TaxID=1936077 RepID=A0A1V4QDN2_UNCW3|nr:MAG: hypothetical protein BXT86_06325 [candidate division WOR-3 bacterium 4484_100]